MVKLKLPDGSSKVFEGNEVPVSEVVESFGDSWKRQTVAVEFDGELYDLHQSLSGEGELRLLRDSDEKSLEVLRHTAAHVLAHAVQELYPGTGFAFGPAIENGFYYDFDVEKPFTPEDLEKIEKKMNELLKRGLPIEREDWAKGKAIEYFKKSGQDFKIEQINDLPGDTVSVYKVGDFVDLCAGPHLDASKRIKSFKVLNSAGAYWPKDPTRPMLQRIYATAFFKKKDLDAYLEQLEEAKKRDHRKLGKQLDLFEVKEEAGGGLVFWLPKGAVVRDIMEGYIKEEYRRRGYQLVVTPHIARGELWHTSGHFDYYKEHMFTMEVDNQEYVVKPMNCPGHILVYKRKLHSYRDLPVRLAEMGTVYRYELSGTLHGLLRVRGFTQDDAHIFCTPEQLPKEIDDTVDFAMDVLKKFGFEQFDVELSVRDPEEREKYAGSDDEWEMAEDALVQSLNRKGISYKRMDGEAVFYGPKIDIKVIDAIGRNWQLSTIQFDFNLARRFDINYVASDGERKQVFMVHRALLGSLERFMGILTEHYAGAFPLWLAPVQCAVLPVTGECNAYAREVEKKLAAAGIRVTVDDRDEKIGYKIRESEMQKVPYMAVVGAREAEQGAVSVRAHTKGDLGGRPLDEFLQEVVDEATAGQ
ncbi:MAG: threonine--tRNA ligase [Candidatus Latescibacterota bacterium]|jgi:threonyl-tRNA synthetase